MFLPSMNSEIWDKIGRCEICARNQANNAKEPMIRMDLPDRPYEKISVDVFELKGKQYLSSVDFFTKWPAVSRLDNLSSQTAIAYLKSHISRYGIPADIVNNNPSYFTSSQFRS